MRFLILKPRTAHFDPRTVDIRDTAHLHELIPPLADCAQEREAIGSVRRAFPDGLAMPMPLSIGSGKTLILGVIADAAEPFDADDDIPFVLFVQPVATTDQERAKIRRALEGKEAVFTKEHWRLAPVAPAFFRTTKIEWRTSELEVPAFLDARVGYDEMQRLVIYAELGNDKMSITFRDRAFSIDTRAQTLPPVSVDPLTVGG